MVNWFRLRLPVLVWNNMDGRQEKDTSRRSAYNNEGKKLIENYSKDGYCYANFPDIVRIHTQYRPILVSSTAANAIRLNR